MQLFCIFDKVAERFSVPFPAVNVGVAHRQFENSCKDIPEIHLADYELYQIGEFDDECGSVKDLPNELVGSGSDFLDKTEKS